MSREDQASVVRHSGIGLDLLRVPLLGSLLRWRHARLVFQLPLAALAILLVVHGLAGPQLAPKNLATLLVWVHWRGALVIGLMLIGNVICFGCPLLLPRELARRFWKPTRRLPRWMRGKRVGVTLLLTILFVYEWLDLWASPSATAVLILISFGTAFLIDISFRGAPFCKSICPIGQFNFISSTLSPFEVKVKREDVCDSCSTKDCIKGVREPQAPASVTQRGCELALFLPQKVGNLDCTFCMDCVHACPEDNIAIAARVPAEELVDDRRRSGIGRLSGRRDLAVLTVLFTFGALLNAFGMVSPVYALQAWMSGVLGTESDFILLGILFVISLLVLPGLLLGSTAMLVTRATGDQPREHLRRFVYALAPLGFSIWVAHYSFHFLTGLWTFVPVSQHALIAQGIDWLGRPQWGLGGLTEAQVWPLEVGFLALGLIGSLGIAWRLAERDYPTKLRAAFVPWATSLAALAGLALWLLGQPMEMRGTFL